MLNAKLFTYFASEPLILLTLLVLWWVSTYGNYCIGCGVSSLGIKNTIFKDLFFECQASKNGAYLCSD